MVGYLPAQQAYLDIDNNLGFFLTDCHNNIDIN